MKGGNRWRKRNAFGADDLESATNGSELFGSRERH
jgi:hypothetical protein